MLKKCLIFSFLWLIINLTRFSSAPFTEGRFAARSTVHEMARDEARHGKALKGLLDRYFK